jgi:TolB protein
MPFHQPWRSLLVASLVVGVPVLMAPPGAAQVPGRNGRIAYSHSTGGGGSDIFTARADGTNRVRLTTSGNAGQPAWSPDGRRIAFVREVARSFDHDIWIMSSAGRGQTRLVGGRADDTDPAWSPDGRRLAFTRNFGQLLVYTLATHRVRLVVGNGFNPSWSPDGTRIAFSRSLQSGSQEQTDLFTVRPDGTALRRVTRTPVNEGQPDWTPNGKSLAYTRGGNGCTLAVYGIRADGSGVRRIWDKPCNDTSPSWAPDGTSVVVYSMGPDPFNHPQEGLWAVRADGTRGSFIVPGGIDPSWQPLP